MNKKDFDKYRKKVKNNSDLCRLTKDCISIIENEDSPEKNYKKVKQKFISIKKNGGMKKKKNFL